MKKFLKRAAFLSAVTAACFGCLIGCGNQTGGGNANGFTVIRFWNGFTGADGETMDRIVEQFNAEYESQKVKVVADKIPWDTLFTKITTTKTNLRSAPHIVAMSASRIAGMNGKGILTELNGIEEYLNVSADEYLAPAWNGGVIGGKRYGFPIDVHPTAMYYNKNLISEEELPTTWAEFKSVCEEKTGNGVYGWAVPSMYSITKDVYLNMLYSAGGSMFNASDEPVFDSAIGAQQLSFLYDLIYGKNPVSPKDVGSGGDFTLFTQGKSLFYFDGPWVINTFGLFDNADSNIGVAPCPESVGEGNSNFAGSHQFTLMKNTVTSDSIKQTCYTFMRYVNEHSIAWAKAGQVPALKAVHETEEYKTLAPLTAFTQMAYTATLGEIGYQYWYEAYNKMGVGVSNALSKIQAPQQALTTAVSDFKSWLEDEAV
jgi:multiple sugar transport system substrate-binding protein